jgi:hypothetical protein
MQADTYLTEQQRRRACLLEEASRIVESAMAESRKLTRAEDSHVLRLLRQAQVLEEQTLRWQRHHERFGRE